MSGISAFFKPQGVAIIGASSKPNKLSYGILENMTLFGFKGAIYPINPNAETILDLKCYQDVADVPDPVDLAVIVLPAERTLEALKACAKRSIKAVIIISGGFREVGAEGKQLEEACLAVARENLMRIIGPNCVGTMDTGTGLDTTFIKGMPVPGPIGFVSQSGAVCGGVVDLLIDRHIGFSHFASLGNEMDVTETDVIEYLGEEPRVKVIAVYVEGISNGQHFMEVAERVGRVKPIVLLKAGRSEAGAKAVSSHTGSLAGAYSAYQAAFKQAGVIEVDNIKELFNVAFALGTTALPDGDNAAIVTNAGGPAALASDSLAMHGIKLAEIASQTKIKLRTKLNPSAQVNNPVDILGGAEAADYDHCLKNLLCDAGVDILLPILVPQALVNPADVARAMVNNAHGAKPLISCLMGERSISEAREILHTNNVPLYQYPEDLGIVLGAMKAYREFRFRGERKPMQFNDIDENKASKYLNSLLNRKSLGELETRPLLEAYGIPVAVAGLAKTEDEAMQVSSNIGYPLVMKIVSEDILHKSDAGGIRMNLNSPEEVGDAFRDMMQKIETFQPEAKITGVLVEQMVPKGQEVIVGFKRDVTFGSMIMIGMGGIYVELLKDVAFKIAPVSEADAREMVLETYAGQLMNGFRGQPKMDIEAVIDVIGKISEMSMAFPEIAEFEINPLIVYEVGKGVKAVDSRAILE